MEFLSRYSKDEVETLCRFMEEFNRYLEEQIGALTGG